MALSSDASDHNAAQGIERLRRTIERLLAERGQTIEDLRQRLDSEAEERHRLTGRRVGHSARPPPVSSCSPRGWLPPW